MAHNVFEVDLTGTKYQTQGAGLPVKIYEITPDQIIGAYLMDLGGGERYWAGAEWRLNGRFSRDNRITALDLVPAPRKVVLPECWLVSRPDGEHQLTYLDRETAEQRKPKGGFIRHVPAQEVEV